MATDAAGWGIVDSAALARTVVVSPHMDDAVLGASHLLGAHRGTTVVTVYAGRPERYPDPPTEWDALGGFTAEDDVAALRRIEDAAALAVLGAVPVWLDFVDHQYVPADQRAKPEAVADALHGAIAAAEPTAVFLPMGIANPDHVVTHQAGLLVRGRMAGPSGGADGAPDGGPVWLCYEDHGYKHIPGLLAWRVSALFRSGLWPTPAVLTAPPDEAAKRAALDCYRSQLPPLERDHSLAERLRAPVPEQHWRLDPPPAGWEPLMDLPG